MTGHVRRLGGWVRAKVKMGAARWRVEGVERERLRRERMHEGSEERRPVVIS